jgi:UDP-N-acetylmuramoyl-L-alanyl-D-glutamate--2,6-diaminopimelate ligase
MKRALQVLKKILGDKLTKKVRPIGHGTKSHLAAIQFGRPARKLKIIGITGTKGKTTTTVFTGRLMNLIGHKTGYVSTALFSVDGVKEIINPYKMTSIDGFFLQKYLRQMVDNGCEYVVLELSSQGLEQNRHWGLGKLDVGVFLNLYPEHLEAHGGLENYLGCKAKMFEHLLPNGKVVLTGDEDQKRYVKVVQKSIPAGCTQYFLAQGRDYRFVTSNTYLKKMLKFGNITIPTNQIADFELKNLAFALQILMTIQPVSNEQMVSSVAQMKSNVPGRMELVVDGVVRISNENEYTVSVLVDYAHEPESLRQLMKELKSWRDSGQFTHLIHVISSDGAGRDDWKKPVMGEISYQTVDQMVITTDNFDSKDDPQVIVDLLGQQLPKGSDRVHKELRRRAAFEKAILLADQIATSNSQSKVLIVSTNVGSEDGLTQPEGVIEWSEAGEWRNLLF